MLSPSLLKTRPQIAQIGEEIRLKIIQTGLRLRYTKLARKLQRSRQAHFLDASSPKTLPGRIVSLLRVDRVTQR